MRLIIQDSQQNITVTVDLSDDRRSLANFLSILDPRCVETCEIRDLKESRLPRNIQRLSHLRQLTLVRCHALESLPPELCKCSELRELGFMRCADFHDLRGIGKLGSLEVLHVSGCDSFDTLPEELSEMHALKALDLSYSEGISWIDLAQLPKSLKLLDMHGCWRASFDPEQVGSLGLVSLQIQELSKLSDSDAVISDLETQLRQMMTMRDGCGLDA